MSPAENNKKENGSRNNLILDLTKIPEEQKNGRNISLKTKEYNHQKSEDSARRNIAYILLALLTVILVWSLTLITISPEHEDKVKDIMQNILSPIIALVSAATGFYYGSKSRDNI